MVSETVVAFRPQTMANRLYGGPRRDFAPPMFTLSNEIASDGATRIPFVESSLNTVCEEESLNYTRGTNNGLRDVSHVAKYLAIWTGSVR